MMKHTLSSNRFLNTEVSAFFHYDYTKYRTANNPDFIVELKNSFNNQSQTILAQAQASVISLIENDLPKVAKLMGWVKPTVCRYASLKSCQSL